MVSQLLPGEDPATRDPDEPALWIAVYSELIGGVRQSLSLARQSPSGAGDVDHLESTVRRFEERLIFWQERAEQLVR
ncbi:MAG: hypothetical protein E6J14_14715 [Chloroflexi bacterium]|nr:MAG: hypothetical protein E6J14_14715 [Chloroflexota bacterium]